MKLPTVSACAKAIGIPAVDWHGKCYGIASAIVDAGLVEGRACYGFYYGPVDPTGYWREQASRGMQRHGWIQLPDERVCDPTRWSFENVEPYLHLGAAGTEYDEGMNRIAEATMQPCPISDSQDELQLMPLSTRAASAVQVLTEHKTRLCATGLSVTSHQQFWIANLPRHLMSPKVAMEVYLFFDSTPILTSLVPLDNMEWARWFKEQNG